MAIKTIAAIEIDGNLPDLSLPKRVDLPVDWKLAPVRSTDLRQYGGQVLDGGNIGLRIKEGPLQGWGFSVGRLQLFDRDWPYLLPDHFYARDISLTLPEMLAFKTGAIGSQGSLEFTLVGATGTGHYLTLLPGINSGTSPALAEAVARRERLIAAVQPFVTADQDGKLLLDPGFLSDPGYVAAFQDVASRDDFPAGRLQGLFSLQAQRASFRLVDALDAFTFSVTGTDAVPGFQADYLFDHNPFNEADHLLHNRSSIALENVSTTLSVGGRSLFHLSSASIPDRPDLEIRGGDWGQEPDQPLISIAALNGSLTLLPFTTAEGAVVYPTLTLTGLQVQQDQDVSLAGVRLTLPKGAVGSLRLGGIVPFDVTGLGLTFERMPDGSVNLSKPTFQATGSLNVPLLQRQLRYLTDSPELQLALRRWSGSEAIPLTPDQSLELMIRVDRSSGALEILQAPALHLELNNLVIPLPGGRQAMLAGSLILGGTDQRGVPQPIPDALLADAGVLELLPDDGAGSQALLAGEIRSGDTRAAAVLRGSLSRDTEGGSLLLEGQVRLEGDLATEAVQLGGAIEATLRWRLEARRGPDGELQLSGFPTIEGVGVQNVSFALGEALRLSVDQLAWTAAPRRDPITGSDGLIARARGLNLEVLAGALAGQRFRSSTAEVLLFDRANNDGIPDHFYIDNLELALSRARLGPLSAEGLRLQLNSLTNLPDPVSGASGVHGAITLEAAAARLRVGDALSGAILPPASPADRPAAEPPEPPLPPALRGSLDLASGDLSLSLQRFEAALTLGGKEAFTLAADGGTAAALQLELRAGAAADATVLTLPSLLGAMPWLAVESFRGRLAPQLQVQGFALQQDGDVQLDRLTLTLPEGYSRQWALAGVVPLELQELQLRFPSHPDGSADLARPQLTLRGRLETERLQTQLRDLLRAPDLALNLARYGTDGVLQPLLGTADVSLEARLDAGSGDLKLLNSPGWVLQLQNLPLPFPGQVAPQLAGTLLLPGTDAAGQPLPLPAARISALLEQAGSTLDPAVVIASAPQLLALLQGSFALEGGESQSLFGADGTLLLSGSLTPTEAGGSRLVLAGEALLSPSLSLPGLSANADLGLGVAWDLESTPQPSGALRFSGLPRLRGARIENLDFRLDELLALQVQSLSWNAEPQLDQIGTAFVPGLIAQGQGLGLALLSGPLAGLSLGSPEPELRLYDLQGPDGPDGQIDHVYLDAQGLRLDNLDLGWLQVETLELALRRISNLPALDPDPQDGRTLSGVIALEMAQAQLGDGLRFDRATGRYDLGENSLALALQGLRWSGAGMTLSGGGQLSIDAERPGDRWLQLQAQGQLDTGLAGLQPLQGELQLTLNRELDLRAIAGRFRAAAEGIWLGDLQLQGDLTVRYDAGGDRATLLGTVNLAGVEAQATIRFTPGAVGFQASLKINNQSSLPLADWLALTPKDVELLYSYNPQQGGQLELDGSAAITLLGRTVDVSADLQVGLGGAGDPAVSLKGGSLQLTRPLEDLNLAGFTVDLIADRNGQLPAIRLETSDNGLIPRLNGAVRLRDLQNLTLQLDPGSGGITYSSDGWNFEQFDLDLTPAGPLDLGLLQIGDAATLRYADGRFSLDPDLALNGTLLGEVLAPVARAIDSAITPISQPVVDVLKTVISLNELSNLQNYKPDWVWGWTWDPIVDQGRKLQRALVSTLEGTPGNPYRDGAVQVVEILDTASYFVYQLLKNNPTLSKVLADQLGLPSAYVEAIAQGAPFVSLAGAVNTLETIADLAAVVNRTQASAGAPPGTDSSDGTDSPDGINSPDAPDGFVAIPDLRFDLRAGAVAETLGTIGKAAREDSAILRKLLEVQQAWRAGGEVGSSPDGGEPSPSSLFRVAPELKLPLLDDPLTSVVSLLKNEPLDLVQFNLGLEADLGLEYNQSLPVAVGPVVLPLVLGGQAGLKGEIEASLGLTATRATLADFEQRLSGDVSLAEVASAVSNLLAPAEADGLGLYLAGQPNQPLLQLEPRIRIQGGVDAGAAGVRAFLGLQGSLNVQLAKERLYLGPLVQSLTGDTPPTPAELGRLFSFDASLSAPFGIDAKILGWLNLLTITAPLYNLQVPRVYAGPAVLTDVLFDERSYSRSGQLIDNLNRRADPGELIARTDSRGAYRFAEVTFNPRTIGNHDAVLDFRDGMMIAGQASRDLDQRDPDQRDPGQSALTQVDSISGADLGLPLVGLPGENITLSTTLKYANLLRWRPDQTIAGQPLTPQRITDIFAGIIRHAPRSFRDDDFDAYQAIASADPKVAGLGVRTLIFSYQHLAAVLTIREMFRSFQLAYGKSQAWLFPPKPQGIDAPELVAFGAYGRAIRSRFGPADADGNNPLDPLGRPPLATRFEVTNPEHLRAVFAEILTAYPTRRLFLETAAGEGPDALSQAFVASGRTPEQQATVATAVETRVAGFLDRVATGLSAITTTIGERLRAAHALDQQIPSPGAQLLIPALAGPKRKVITALIPRLIQAAQEPDNNRFEKRFFSLFYQPTTVDAPDRSFPFLIQASSQADALIPTLRLRSGGVPETVSFHLNLVDPDGQPVQAPDYGLTIRYRLGGSARVGRDYALPEDARTQVIAVAPGQSSASLTLTLLPGFAAQRQPLLQLELLSADSGYRIDPEAAVISVGLAGRMPADLSGAHASFRPSHLVAGEPAHPAAIVNPVETPNAVLRGVEGQADAFVLRPCRDGLVHLENFRPEEGDHLWIKPAALRNLRRSFPQNRSSTKPVRATALRQLRRRLGLEAFNALEPDQRAELLVPLIEALDPRPPVRARQLNTYGGFLFDRVSGQPLALISANTPQEGDQAYSSLSPDPILGAISILRDSPHAPILSPPQSLSLEDAVSAEPRGERGLKAGPIGSATSGTSAAGFVGGSRSRLTESWDSDRSLDRADPCVDLTSNGP